MGLSGPIFMASGSGGLNFRVGLGVVVKDHFAGSTCRLYLVSLLSHRDKP